MRQTCFAGLALAVAAILPAGALAGPIDECALMTEEAADLRVCLDTQLEITTEVMMQAHALARAAAERIDVAAGGDAAVLGVEASQQAWEAFRDVNCGLRELLQEDGAAAEHAERSCRIRMTRARTEELQDLALRAAH